MTKSQTIYEVALDFCRWVAAKHRRIHIHCRCLAGMALMQWPAAAFSQQSALEPASAQASGIAVLWWSMFYGACIIFVLVMALLVMGLWRGRRQGGNQYLSHVASRNLVLAAGVIIPLLVIIVLVGGSLMLGRTLAMKPSDNNVVTIAVTGWMWWWQVEYLDENGQIIATTANEIHVPVGRPVELLLTSRDVIHSFWVPELHGKTDMNPGSVNSSWFTAQKPGVYRGQCAEFCGTQHALMAFLVVAQPSDEFEQWLARQAQPASEPATAAARRGEEVFLASGCADCHTVRGTSAQGKDAPDLTHVGSRKTLAAATRPNTRGHLGGWIADPQNIKPGNFMPATRLGPEDFTALLTYLESLK